MVDLAVSATHPESLGLHEMASFPYPQATVTVSVITVTRTMIDNLKVPLVFSIFVFLLLSPHPAEVLPLLFFFPCPFFF